MDKNVSNTIYETLSYYRYEPTHEACDKIVKKWEDNKGSLIELLSKHPNYNGNYQIFIQNDLQREVYTQGIYKFCGNLWAYATDQDKESIFAFEQDERTFDLLEIFLNNIRYNTEKIASENIIFAANHLLNETKWKGDPPKFTEFQSNNPPKISKLVKKVASLLKLDKIPEWETEYASFADAINPRKYPANCVISVHPDDFLKMSNGNSWLSCMWIDKFGVDCITDDNGDDIESYSGCYSGGTLSYMLDKVTFMLYLIDDYDPDVELPLSYYSKVKRNLFHYYSHRLVQGRVYPQALDGDKQIYKQLRGVVQDTIAKCLGIPNLWRNSPGTSAVSKVCYNKWGHYYDLEHFSDCNVSYPSNEQIELDGGRFCVGHEAICPKCGNYHHVSEHVTCNYCWDESQHPGERQCYRCGCFQDIEDMHLIEDDGDEFWYCDDCCTYCDYHERYERGTSDNFYYITNYHGGSYVCDSALDSDEFVRCDCCESWFYDDGLIHLTDDGDEDHVFCSENCAKSEGWVKVRGKWTPSSQAVYCEHCQEWVLHEEYNFSKKMCRKCQEKPCDTCGKVSDDDCIFVDGKKFCCEECANQGGYVYVNKKWRKKETCNYCNLCKRWVLSSCYDDYKDCCKDCAYDNEELTCPVCGKKYIRKNGVKDLMSSDTYCCEECILKDGYVKTNKGYCQERYAFFCPDCERYFTSDDFNFTEGKCEECWSKDRCHECSMRHHRHNGVETCDLMHYCNAECAKAHGYSLDEETNTWVREEQSGNLEEQDEVAI